MNSTQITGVFLLENAWVWIDVTRFFALPSEFILQTDRRSHFAALVGIMVLAVLAGSLHVKKRLTRTKSEDSGYTDQQSVKTDRELVCSLIRDNGGRMKQSAIVDSVDWSKAKVSRLLSELENDGQVTKLRLGRENLVCIRGHEPQLSRSSDSSTPSEMKRTD
ncbi:winged helix-turn-helix transcriptional regulator [Halobacteria archaeon AArc-curdl1]|uniref:Winged helix-turn-helix transcriptional regulator n=1 Tax=Natronosalvus hydrolyticus TaxID=2979988 RepID=A0AAP2ZDW7_9EURY|nr:winged helix-turn-helix transcriptional regulator [Halobacteria archaeon AArc-curdl1]